MVKIEELREIRVEMIYWNLQVLMMLHYLLKVDNEDTLKKYATNPLHVEVIKNYIKPFVYDRVCIDFFE